MERFPKHPACYTVKKAVRMAEMRTGAVAPGIAFITGGARGLGNAIACSFAKEGSKGIALVDIQDDTTFAEGKANVENYGTKVGSALYAEDGSVLTAKCIAIHADVTQEDQVERAIKETVEAFGRIDHAAYRGSYALGRDHTDILGQQLRRDHRTIRDDLGHRCCPLA